MIQLYLGTCYYELGQYDLAKEQFLLLTKNHVSNRLEAEARYRLAAIHWRQGALAQTKLRLEEVVSVLGTAMEPNVPRGQVYELLSKTCHHLGEEENAGGPLKPHFGLSGDVRQRKLALCPGD